LRTVVVMFAAACSALACAQPPPAAAPFVSVEPPEPRAWIGEATLSPEGLGAIRIGESIASVQALLGYRLEQAEPVALSPGCGEWSISFDQNAGVAMMTQDAIVQSITLYGATGVRTAEGVAVGDTAAHVLRAYPDAERRRAEYTPEPGHELFVWSDREHQVGLRFEIGEDERVTAIHAGGDLRNDEGCMTA
jgi:hypothetical protein